MKNRTIQLAQYATLIAATVIVWYFWHVDQLSTEAVILIGITLIFLQGFKGINERVDGLHWRVNELDKRIESMKETVDGLHWRIAELAKQVAEKEDPAAEIKEKGPAGERRPGQVSYATRGKTNQASETSPLVTKPCHPQPLVS